MESILNESNCYKVHVSVYYFEMNQLSVEDTDGNDLIAERGYPTATGKNKYKMYYNKPKSSGNIILKTIELPYMKLNQDAQITVNIP